MKVRMRIMIERSARGAALLATVVFAGSCLQGEGPEDPTPVPYPTLVSVRIEYRQPSGCLNVTSNCEDVVRFFASWLPANTYITLNRVSGTFVWTGQAFNVPANYPPIDQPYLVRISDPYLLDYQTQGATADRLQIGGQILTRFYEYGTPAEAGLVYIDDRGVGHNP